jgi:hypothetical protein
MSIYFFLKRKIDHHQLGMSLNEEQTYEKLPWFWMNDECDKKDTYWQTNKHGW